jgi:hypothetical protein
MLKIIEIIKEIRAGSSLPILILANDNKYYLVKMSGSGDGVFSNLVDYISLYFCDI